jgi:cyanophycinase
MRERAAMGVAVIENVQTGRLLIVGGAERRSPGGDRVLQRFVELAGGMGARIGVIATASREPRTLEDDYVQAFGRLGADAEAVRVDDREQANGDAAVAAISAATAVFFTGGDQLRIATVVGGTRVDSVLHARVSARELLLGGSSAGAAMMSSTMIVGGEFSGVETDSVWTGPGMEFLPGVLIDMHFAERGRIARLLSAVAMYPHELGLGIDEGTAILVDGGRFEVLGSGSVTVIDAGQADMIRLPDGGHGSIAMTGVRLHVLPAGHAFELTGRYHVAVEAPEDTHERGDPR